MTKAKAATIYKTMQTYESKSKPGEIHTVKEHRTTGALSCDCMSWIMNPTCPRCEAKTKTVEKGVYRCPTHGVVPRACKHIRHFTTYEAPVKKAATLKAPLGGLTATEAALGTKPDTPMHAALLAAAIETGVRGLINEHHWAILASKLEIRLLTAERGADPGSLEGFDEFFVRHIVLED